MISRHRHLLIPIGLAIACAGIPLMFLANFPYGLAVTAAGIYTISCGLRLHFQNLPRCLSCKNLTVHQEAFCHNCGSPLTPNA